MGEVRVQVKVQGITPAGDLVGAPTTAEALVDTGASKTVVSKRVAEQAGIAVSPRLTGHVTGATGRTEIPIGMAAVMARNCHCEPETLLVGISDRITRNARAEIVLGHDYMQAAYMVVTPHAHAAACVRPPRKMSPTRTTTTKRAAARRRTT